MNSSTTGVYSFDAFPLTARFSQNATGALRKGLVGFEVYLFVTAPHSPATSTPPSKYNKAGT